MLIFGENVIKFQRGFVQCLAVAPLCFEPHQTQLQ